MNCWVLSTSSMILSESDVSISLPPGLCNRAVHTAARHSEGKAGVDIPPLWYQQRRIYKQRGDAVLSRCVFAHQLKVSLRCNLCLSSRKWHRLWEPSMTWWANTPTLRWRETSHSSMWTLSFRFVCDYPNQTLISIQQGKRKQHTGVPSANAKLILSYNSYFTALTRFPSYRKWIKTKMEW